MSETRPRAGATEGESPTADALRVEAWVLYKKILATAKGLRTAKNSREASALGSAVKALEVARKSLSDNYSMARHREELNLLERYEALQRKLGTAAVESRRAHSEEREH